MIKIDVRKLISFGKGSFIISMPKSWIEKNHLKKGDLISVNDDGHELVVRAGHDEAKPESKEITIDAKESQLEFLKTEIVSAYLNCYDTLNIVFDSKYKDITKIKEIIRNLSGLEIMEQTSTKIVARNLININEISLQGIIRRMDIITRAMMEDSILCCRGQATYESIHHRDADVNRIYYLGMRIIKNGIKNPRIAKSLETDAWQLHSDSLMIMRLEKIADRQKRIARLLSFSNLDRETLENLEALYNVISESYNDVMKSYYSKEKKLAYNIEVSNKERIRLCDRFLEKYTETHPSSRNKSTNSKLVAVAHIVDNLKATSASIKNMARTVLCYE